MPSLGKRKKTGAIDNQNPVKAGGWTIVFDPAFLGIQVPFEVYHAAVRGPAGSQFEVWIDDTFYSASIRGDRNEWDPSQPMHVTPGETIFFYYNTANGPAPTVAIFCRESSPI